MPDAAEFTDPVGYSAVWVVLAVVLVVLVVAYYAGVAWWARAVPTPEESGAALESAQREHLRRLDRIDTDLKSGRLTLRGAFQELSATVRSFVDDVSEVPARFMALEDLRTSADPKVADTIATMYPPEFAPDDTDPDAFRQSFRQARELVRSWT